jgi:hypothetical protein
MKHCDRLTNRIALELAFPVDRRGVREPLRKDSPQSISMHPCFHRQTKTASMPCRLPPAGIVAHAHPSTSRIYMDDSIPIRPDEVERFSPIHF